MNSEINKKRFEQFSTHLLSYGEKLGPYLPWHDSKNPYHWMVVEILLRRTTRSAASKAFESLIEKYPSWGQLANAEVEDIYQVISWVGLGKQRAKQLKDLAESIIDKYNGKVPEKKKDLVSLPGIGNYASDALLLHVFKKRVVPLDPNFQRLARRYIGLPTSIGTRHSESYKDPWAVEISKYFIDQYQAEQLQNIHRGLLYLAWNFCRPKPKCGACPLNNDCSYSLSSIG